YAYNYKSDGITVKSTSVNFYGISQVRASSAGEFDALTRSDSHNIGLISGVLDSNRRASSYFVGEKRDEIADYAYNYKSDGITVKSTSVNFYGISQVRASSAGEFDALTRSDSHNIGLISGVLDSNRRSSSYFVGEKGDEIADYAYNYKSDGITVKSTSVNFYGSSQVRASSAGEFDALTRSDSHNIGLISGVLDSNRRASSYFVGEKRDEIADYAYNYKSDGITVKSTSVNFYGISQVRASSAGEFDALTRSDSHNIGLISGVLDSNRRSSSYFVGEKGDEIADYAYNYKSDGITVKSTSVNFYGSSQVRASSAGEFDALTRSDSHNIGLISGVLDSNRRASSYFVGEKRDEIADYAYNYKSDGITVKSTSVNFYGISQVRASSAGEFDALTRSDSHNIGLISGVLDSNRRSSSYFVGEKGDEIADYAYNYKSDGITVKSTSVNFYGSSQVRASSAGEFDALTRSDSHNIGLISGVLDSNRRASSYFVGEKRDEIADYAYNYKSDGITVKSTSVNFYGISQVRASSAGEFDALTRSDSHNIGLISGVLDSNRRSSSYFVGEKGDEIADYAYNYKSDGITVKSTSVNFYGSSQVRASSAGEFDALTRSDSHNIGLISGVLDSNRRASSYFVGEKRDEIADYAYNYKSDGITVKSTSVNFYGISQVRASSAGEFDALTRSDSHNIGLISGVLDSNRRSSSYFVGEKGDEIADYAYNYKSDGITVKSTSVNFYGSSQVRASSAGEFDALTRSDSHNIGLISGVLDSNRRSSSYFVGEKGDEIADYAYNYKSDGITVKSTSVNFYGISQVRASSAGEFDALTRSDSHNIGLISGVLDSNRRSSSYFVGEKGDEIADYAYNYKSDGITVKSTSVNFYGSSQVRASSAGEFDALTRSDSHNIGLISGVLDSNRRSSSYFVGEKGDEIADYAYNYKSDGTTVKSTSVNFYGTSQVRASSAGEFDALTRSDSHNIGLISGVLDSNRRSSSSFVGEKGDEIADYAYNYKSDGTTVKSTSVNFYGTSQVRASSAGEFDAL